MISPRDVILCVDDEEKPLILRKMVLEKAGYDVLTAGSAQQALDLAESHDIDLVLCDHLMPGTTGAELARHIKARYPELPVILLSGLNEIPQDAGSADLFLSKVEGPDSLCEKIAAVLESSEGSRK